MMDTNIQTQLPYIPMMSEQDFKREMENTWEVRRDKSKIKVLLLYIAYPLAMASYFRKALSKRADVDLLVTGPFTGSWIPWQHGTTVPEKYVNPPDIPLPFPPDVRQVNYDFVRAQLPQGWIPDLVLTVDAGINWKDKPNQGYAATVGTDPHVLNYEHARKVSDKFFNMQLCYSQKDDEYLPYAYSPDYHYPDDTVSKDADCVLIGLQYEKRVQWVSELRRQGCSILFDNGPVYDEYRQINNRARIGLNWSSMDDLNARAMELAAMKLCPVMNYVPDAHRFFCAGTHYLEFVDLGGAVEQVMWAKNNPEKAQEIAEAAYRNITSQNMTYDDRCEQILKMCRFV